MKYVVLVVSLLFLNSPYLFCDTFSPEQAQNKIGQQERIVGVVSEVFKSPRGTTYLNFGGKYPEQTFSIVIFSSDSAKFKDLKEYSGKKVAVIGKIEQWKGKSEIIVREPQQMSVIE